MNININSKTIKRLIVPALIIILIIICVEIKENSMEDKFAVTISSMNEEKQNLNDKITSLEEELKKCREENGHMSSQLRNAKENIDLLKYYAEKHGLHYQILDCFGEVDCWEQCGRFTLFPETEEEKRILVKLLAI